MKADVFGIDGKKTKQVELPKVFKEKIREDLIKRAVLSDQSKKYQPKGNYIWAGLETSARYRGRKEAYGSLKNKGQAMLPREIRPKGRWGDVKVVPFSKGGRRAHPPKVEKVIIEKINKKEYEKALKSAIAATANLEIVQKRGHKTEIVPIILEDTFNKINKTKEINKILSTLFREDLKRGKETKKRTTRKAGKRTPKTALIVVTENSDLLKSSKNISGLDVVLTKDLTVELLAPGASAGRLTCYTESALKELEKM
ncbi:50S ribosomal protein L4 [Candidatus Micrarchaeota archaeon]|nr:50S ribosomal protein L4 [Candidatus Micrarchaeota archaeon]